MKEKKPRLYRNVADSVAGQPETCDELLHKYGTYEIQPTCDSDNEFPEISQAMPKNEKNKSFDRHSRHVPKTD